jgi:hypothetical protein
VFTRFTEEADAETGINIALVDVQSGMIGENTGTRPTAAADEAVPERKP